MDNWKRRVKIEKIKISNDVSEAWKKENIVLFAFFYDYNEQWTSAAM